MKRYGILLAILNILSISISVGIIVYIIMGGYL
ncbi:membrane protein [Bacillus phage Nachito]|nr:membrane protein [Bacillus phage Nachito]